MSPAQVVPFWHGQELFLACQTRWRARPFWVHGAGHNNVTRAGINQWVDDGAAHNQSFVVLRDGAAQSVAAAIDELLLREPAANRKYA